MKFFLVTCFLVSVVSGEPLHGPNVNPANLAVLVEWERQADRQAGIIGDNFSAETWEVFQTSGSFRNEPQGAMAHQLKRWRNAFDGNNVLESSEGSRSFLGEPLGALEDYLVELAIPIFPGRLVQSDGELVDSADVSDRWEMASPTSRHHRKAKASFRALAQALVDAGMADACLRLGWEFTGDWFPWSIDPRAGERAGTPEEFKEVWKFIYLTMEEVNPRFRWVWCPTVAFDHIDPREAFPEYPGEKFSNPADNEDKILVDFVSTDIYDADGESYFRDKDELVPGYWNTRSEQQKKAFEAFRQKVFAGQGPFDGDSNEVVGLRFLKDFADEKGLPFAISEWGLWANFVPAVREESVRWLRAIGFGGDDNPHFINGFFQWIRENDLSYACLFEFYSGGEGDTVDHTLLRNYWTSPREGRPEVRVYPPGSPYEDITDQLHPRAGQAYFRQLKIGDDAE
jgi:hypothetical protein